MCGDSMFSDTYREKNELISWITRNQESNISVSGSLRGFKGVEKGLGLDIDWQSWDRPVIYSLIQNLGNVPEEDMRATFNLGIGLIAVADKSMVERVLEKAAHLGEPGVKIGRIKKIQ